MTFIPDWSKSCKSPDKHLDFHVWLDLGDGFHKIWCKLCAFDGMPITLVNEAQKELNFEKK